MQHLSANNLNITGSSVSGTNITFNISWENSWNVNTAPNNWDAVWVIVKYQDCATREWAHANLSTLSTDHTAGSPLQVDAVSDGKGVFIRRNAVGGGNISSTSVTLKMNITAGTYNYKVLGIEMVNVPAGSFYIGDGATANYSFNQRLMTSTDQSAGATVYFKNNATAYTSQYTVTSSYPMGTNSFYCMKYEITQQQYVDFLNALTLTQQINRTAVDPNSAAGTYALYGTNRNGVAIMTSANGLNPAVYGCNLNSGNAFNSSDDGQNMACNFLNSEDVSAYLDWSALRPMSEMEYEKICRGVLAPITGEYAWGNTTLTAVNSANLVNSGTSSEAFNNTATGLCNYNSAITGPVRVGYAATGSSGRGSAGAGYYGALDMAGNVNELTVHITPEQTYSYVGSGNNRSYGTSTYTGILGDGTISPSGIANTLNWPSGTSFFNKGGSYVSTATEIPVSYRPNTYGAASTRNAANGGRGIR